MSKLIDLTGQRYGRLTVIERAESSKQPSGQTKTRWRCKCDCGNEIVVLGHSLKSGNTQSCGCLNSEKTHERTFVDLTGQKFNKLTVIERAEDHEQPGGQRKTMWRCRCDCGNETIVTAYDLFHGHTKSCGCILEEYHENSRNRDPIRSRIYAIYYGMRYRCYSKNCSRYKNYGERGIKICKEWMEDYDSFEKWALENGYKDGLSIERIDVNGDYCPENCTWVSLKEQSRNKCNTVRINVNGNKYTIIELSELTGLSYGKIYYRYSNGWSGEEIMNDIWEATS